LAQKTVIVVKTGTTEPTVVRDHGDYDDWFAPHLRAAGLRPILVAAHLGEAPPSSGFDGVILTGSPLSVRDDDPWMKTLGRWTLETAASHPVLAVCFGHQLVGHALGGRVMLNPAGGEFGTIAIRLSPAGRGDPLFAGISEDPTVQSTHRDILAGLPPGCTALAGNANTKVQAFAWGPRLRAVQFHPEIPPQALQQLIEVRGLGGDPGTSAVSPSHIGDRLLNNWIHTWVHGSG
jgi:GMP synthase (glutamine-hydrolysing)